LQTKIEALHEAVVKGDLRSVQSMITRMKMAVSKDENGHGLLHKAVYYGFRDIVDWLIEKYPETLDVKDWVRTCPNLTQPNLTKPNLTLLPLISFFHFHTLSRVNFYTSIY
jgi:hypothetical protein